MSRPVQQLDCVGAGVSCAFSGTTGTITVSGGSGTVTSITQGTGMSFSVTPITATGTINLATPVSLANGGTNAALTADTGAIPYSSASALTLLASTATANKVLLSGASAAPVWSTPTFPNASATAGKYIRSDGTNWIASTGSASGTGACAASNWASTLTSDAAPTCTRPGMADLSSSTSASLATVLSDETGSGVAVFATSPSLTTPTIAQILNTGTLTLPTSTDTLVGRATTDTLTNKRITKREVSVVDGTSMSPNSDTSDTVTQANTQPTGTLTINNPSGTPTASQVLNLRLKSTNVQTFSWASQYRGSSALPLPTASTGNSKTDYMGFQWNAADSTWDILAKNFGF